MQKRVHTKWRGSSLSLPSSGALLPLTCAQVEAAEACWGKPNRSEWNSQWSAIEVLVTDIWNTDDDDVDRLQRLWVFLAYAIGNFKRQGGTNIFPMPSPWGLASLSGSRSPRDTIDIPLKDGALLTMSSTGTTEKLERGLRSVSTGSTLLSALWPGEHAIFDTRDFRVAVALLAYGGAPIVESDESSPLYPPDWEEYLWFLRFMKAEAARLKVSILVLERALFTAYEFFPKKSEMSWQECGAGLVENWGSVGR